MKYNVSRSLPHNIYYTNHIETNHLQRMELSMAVDWYYYDKYENLIGKYMPMRGEGETKASQIVTAVNKLIYKWYNDGDVFDNTYNLYGWVNDLSSYANWLYNNTDTKDTLLFIRDCDNESDYEDLLKFLADDLFNEEFLEEQDKLEKVGSIYECNGFFEFDYNYGNEEEEDEEDDWCW